MVSITGNAVPPQLSQDAAARQQRLLAAVAAPGRRALTRAVAPLGIDDTELFALIAEGRESREIARRARASVPATQARIRWLMHVTESRNRAHLVATAVRRGWIEWAGTYWRARPDKWTTGAQKPPK